LSLLTGPGAAHLLSQWAGPATAFFQVVMIDLTLAGDNALAVGLAAASLRREQQRRAIMLGLAASVVMLSGFALIAVQLLKLMGLLLAGGLLLLWVCWRMWRDLRAQDRARDAAGEAALEGHPLPASGPPKTLLRALIQILIADVSMSLDNVLAVAGAAKDHPQVLVFGLVLSITLTGFAAAWIAKFLHRFPWLGYLGLAIVLYVACHMVWEGYEAVAQRTSVQRTAVSGAPPNRSAQADTSAASIFLNSTSGTVILRPPASRLSSARPSGVGQARG
jgi:YjbE family integral membrane protein